MYDLKDILDYCQFISDSIARAFDLDITIVNHDLIRIAGTGNFKQTINQRVPQGVLAEVALANKKNLIVDNPRESRYCANCTKKGCDDAVVFISDRKSVV